MNSYQLANAIRYQSTLTRSLSTEIASGIRSTENESHYIVTVFLSALGLAAACISFPPMSFPIPMSPRSLPHASLDIDCTHLKQAGKESSKYSIREMDSEVVAPH